METKQGALLRSADMVLIVPCGMETIANLSTSEA